MSKIILLIIFTFGSMLHAEINEYKSDVYFANGINTADKSAEATKNEIETMYKFHNPTFYKSVNDWKVAVNYTQGIGNDLWESASQKLSTEYWLIKWIKTGAKFILSVADSVIKNFVIDEIKGAAKGKLSSMFSSHDSNLKTQVTSYKNSIKDGHGVIVLAHSQGNLFTQVKGTGYF